MKILNHRSIVGVLSSAILSGCQGFSKGEATPTVISADIPQTKSDVQIENRQLNLSIENYIDKYLSEIIRIRNFNRERVSKVFCVHNTGYVESAIKAPDALRVYVKLLCVEAISSAGGVAIPITAAPGSGKSSSPSKALIGNPISLISRIDVYRIAKSSGNKTNLESFRVSTDDTPRDMPYYLNDLRRILSNEMMDIMKKIQPDEKAQYQLLNKKALDYQKQQSQKCK